MRKYRAGAVVVVVRPSNTHFGNEARARAGASVSEKMTPASRRECPEPIREITKNYSLEMSNYSTKRQTKNKRPRLDHRGERGATIYLFINNEGNPKDRLGCNRTNGGSYGGTPPWWKWDALGKFGVSTLSVEPLALGFAPSPFNLGPSFWVLGLSGVGRDPLT